MPRPTTAAKAQPLWKCHNAKMQQKRSPTSHFLARFVPLPAAAAKAQQPLWQRRNAEARPNFSPMSLISTFCSVARSSRQGAAAAVAAAQRGGAPEALTHCILNSIHHPIAPPAVAKAQQPLWKRRNAEARQKREYKTADEVVAEAADKPLAAQPILDLRGPQARLISNLEHLNVEVEEKQVRLRCFLRDVDLADRARAAALRWCLWCRIYRHFTHLAHTAR